VKLGEIPQGELEAAAANLNGKQDEYRQENELVSAELLLRENNSHVGINRAKKPPP
jgi:hypothetical protein